MSRPYIDLSACDDADSTREAYRDADQYMDDRPTRREIELEERRAG